MEVKFNRKQYMAGECDHDTYYGQFVTPSLRRVVNKEIGTFHILKSSNPSFNDIPLKQWEALRHMVPDEVRQAIASSNASTTVGGARAFFHSDAVCVTKAAARAIKKEYQDAAESDA